MDAGILRDEFARTSEKRPDLSRIKGLFGGMGEVVDREREA